MGTRNDIVDEDVLEIMEFLVGGNSYGINVAKIREVVQYRTPTPSPDQHPCVEGMLMLRGKPIPIIDLAKRLKTEETKDTERDLFIITTFNNLIVGLHVHKINGIRKLAWSKIRKPDETISRHSGCIVTGIVDFNDYITILLDFEKIVADINPTTTIQVSDVSEEANDALKDKPIMIIDDSPMLNKLIKASLVKAGFTNIVSKANGKEAWDALFSYKGSKDILSIVSCVITDIEMPAMDGLTLCKKIKADSVLHTIPVVLFSSIIEESMRIKGEAAGADAQISKPDIKNLVSILDTVIK